MTWFLIAIFAYFLNAVAITVDKFLLSKKIPNPAVYAFFIATLSLVALVLLPFGFQFYSWPQIFIALIAGLIFTFALLYLFKALSQNEASRITPFMGGFQPLFIFILAWFFLSEKLGFQQLMAFILIILGTVFISGENNSTAAKKQAYFWALISTFLFAISYTLNKYVFINQNFISGFIWTRVGSFFGALLLLLSLKNRQAIKTEIKKPKKQTGRLFLFGQTAGALSFILVNYAIAISPSVALINALQGLQYVFLLIIIFSLSWKFPKLLKEKMTPRVLTVKVLATLLIIGGLFILFI